MKGAIRTRGQKEEKGLGLREERDCDLRASRRSLLNPQARRESSERKKQGAPSAQPKLRQKRATSKRPRMSTVSTAMAHEKGGNQKVKRGIARREARTTHPRRGEEGREGERREEDGGGGGGRRGAEHAGGEGGRKGKSMHA